MKKDLDYLTRVNTDLRDWEEYLDYSIDTDLYKDDIK